MGTLRPVVVAASVALCLAPWTIVRAQSRTVPRTSYGSGRAYTLAYDHLSGQIELRDDRGRVRERWSHLDAGTRLVARVPPDRVLAVVAENANSLL